MCCLGSCLSASFVAGVWALRRVLQSEVDHIDQANQTLAAAEPRSTGSFASVASVGTANASADPWSN